MADWLPLDVVRRVLGCLPLWQRVRCGTVCKLWKTLISSINAAAQEPSLICIPRSDHTVTLWCPDSQETFCACSADGLLSPPWSPRPILKALASSAGLVLGLCQDPDADEEDLHLAVGNPLLNKWEKLPTPHLYCSLVRLANLNSVSTSGTSMLVNPLSGHYKIVLSLQLLQICSADLHSAGFEYYVPHIFDSMARTWHTVDQIPIEKIKLKRWFNLRNIFSGCGFTYDIQLQQHRILEYHNGNQGKYHHQVGIYKGRSIYIACLGPCSRYQVLELELEKASQEFILKELSMSPDFKFSSSEDEPSFMFEGDYVVAFCKHVVIAFNLDKLSWHCFKVPVDVVVKADSCFIFKPTLNPTPGQEH